MNPSSPVPPPCSPRTYRTSASSRERNRMHARKTRQRKKEQMQRLQGRADELKREQIRLKQAINERGAASTLAGLFRVGGVADGGGGPGDADPGVEALLRRPNEDIPDASKIPELPALVLPGQHGGRRKAGEGDGDGEGALGVPEEPQDDGIDYALLGKDRSSCTPAELDQIRRERNRMHAKRTRDRKRIFMEEMEVMMKQLEEENLLLRDHMKKLNVTEPPAPVEGATALTFPQTITPELAPLSAPPALSPPSSYSRGALNKTSETKQTEPPPQTKGDFLDQIESLLAAAGSFQKKPVQSEINAVSCVESDITTSDNHSDHSGTGAEEEHEQLSGPHPNKRQKTSDLPTSVPKSISTANISLMW